MSFAIAAGPVSTANAAPNYFCDWVILAPYGQNGDRCDANHGQGGWSAAEGGQMWWVGVYTGERAGCAAWRGYYGEQIGSWHCVGGGGQYNQVWAPQSGWIRGTIRNNNTNQVGQYLGIGCCWP
jgi:hypothetical protein